MNEDAESIISVQKVVKLSVKASDVICKRVRNLEVVILILPQCILHKSTKYNLCLRFIPQWIELNPENFYISLSFVTCSFALCVKDAAI